MGTAPLLTPPLSPQERDALTDDDRMRVDAWRFRMNGWPPGEDDLLRLYLLGKQCAPTTLGQYRVNTTTHETPEHERSR